jgi:hypothetical protein
MGQSLTFPVPAVTFNFQNQMGVFFMCECVYVNARDVGVYICACMYIGIVRSLLLLCYCLPYRMSSAKENTSAMLIEI